MDEVLWKGLRATSAVHRIGSEREKMQNVCECVSNNGQKVDGAMQGVHSSTVARKLSRAVAVMLSKPTAPHAMTIDLSSWLCTKTGSWGASDGSTLEGCL